MKAEIIILGTEILLGQIIDTNASFLARQLASIGFDVYRKTTVGDNEERIAEAIRSGIQHADVVITSGGLGPTVDDKTRDAVAHATDRELVLDEDLLAYITAFIKRRGFKLGKNNPRQAQIPSDSIPIHNPVGTAPGFIVNHNGSFVISLPGVPHELHHLMENTVLPFLKEEFGLQAIIKTRVLRTAGEGESKIDRQIAELEESNNPTVGLAAHPGAVDIRISAKAEHEDDALKMLDDMEARLRQRVGDIIFGMDEETIQETIVKLLVDQELSMAALETNTGGFIAHMLTHVPGGLDVNVHTLVTTGRRIGDLLPDDLIGEPIVSKEVAESLAEAIRKQAGVDIGLAVVGDEDPEVGPYSKRTGDTFVGVSLGDKIYSQHIQLGGISKDARTRIFNATMAMLRKCLLETKSG